MRSHTFGVIALILTVVSAMWTGSVSGQEKDELAAKLRQLDARVLSSGEADARKFGQMLGQDIRTRRTETNRRESTAWRALKTRADWELFRDARLKALRASLGNYPPPPKDLKVRVTRTLPGEGFGIENLVYESRPGLVVTANLYVPEPLRQSMPGILICHSHHNPKTQGELQDMGMTWARLGCLVLVMDQLGHGERRQHPFCDASKYKGTFKVGRQDYYFRYNVGNQLYVIGDCLMGWMVWDLMRGVDLLLSRPGVDAKRIILLGAVAGGGDPAAVTAALDRRIAAVVPFNFGGPQPETTYPLPKNAEDAFNYAGGGSWESTRNLRLSARDGFMPWVIVGSVAPRGLSYAHEFAWDRDHDPVWTRLVRIYDWYGARDRLASVAGRGKVTGKPPESTHCNNIGPVHRRQVYPALKRWFGIPEPEKEYQKRRSSEDFICLTPKAADAFKPQAVYQLAGQLGAQRAATARQRLGALAPKERAERLRQEWARLLGPVQPANPDPLIKETLSLKHVSVRRAALNVEAGIRVPLVLLVPRHASKARLPVVVGLAQEGKSGFLKHRAETVAALLRGGCAVCLPDLRGTGETRPAGDSRGRTSASTSLSASELMLGRTLLGDRLRDLRTVLRFLRQVAGAYALDPQRIALWGDSFASVNDARGNLAVPWDAAKLPPQSEPLGGLLALFGALYEPHVQAVYARGGLSGYLALLHSPFLYVPHDAIVPEALTAGDLCDVAAVLAPRPVRLEGLVDGLNRRLNADKLDATYAPARAAYEATQAQQALSLRSEPGSAEDVARWLLARLKEK